MHSGGYGLANRRNGGEGPMTYYPVQRLNRTSTSVHLRSDRRMGEHYVVRSRDASLSRLNGRFANRGSRSLSRLNGRCLVTSPLRASRHAGRNRTFRVPAVTSRGLSLSECSSLGLLRFWPREQIHRAPGVSLNRS